jgi:hypothetical protein
VTNGTGSFPEACRATSSIPAPSSSSTTHHDDQPEHDRLRRRDKILYEVDLGHLAAWAAGSGTLLAGSVEVFNTSFWGTDYRAPVGANATDAVDHRCSVRRSHRAGPGSAVQIDANANGAFRPRST